MDEVGMHFEFLTSVYLQSPYNSAETFRLLQYLETKNCFNLKYELEQVLDENIEEIQIYTEGIPFQDNSTQIACLCMIRTAMRPSIIFILLIRKAVTKENNDNILSLDLFLKFPKIYCINEDIYMNGIKLKMKVKQIVQDLFPSHFRLGNVTRANVKIYNGQREYNIDVKQVNKDRKKFTLEAKLMHINISRKHVLNLCPSLFLEYTDLERFILEMFDIFDNKIIFAKAFFKKTFRNSKCKLIKIEPLGHQKWNQQTNSNNTCEFRLTFREKGHIRTINLTIYPEHFGDIIKLYFNDITYTETDIKTKQVTQRRHLCNIKIIESLYMPTVTFKRRKLRKSKHSGVTFLKANKLSQEKTIKVLKNSPMIKNYIRASSLLLDNIETHWRCNDNIVVLKPSEKFYVYPFGRVLRSSVERILVLADKYEKFPLNYKNNDVNKGLEYYINANNPNNTIFKKIDKFTKGLKINEGNMFEAVYTVAVCVSEAIRHFPTLITNQFLIHLVKHKKYSSEYAMKILPMARKGSWPNKKRTGFRNKMTKGVREAERKIFIDFVSLYGSVPAAYKNINYLKREKLK